MPLLAALVPAALVGLAAGWPPALAPAVKLADALAALAAGAATGLGWDWRVPPPPVWVIVAAAASWIAVALALERGRAWRIAAGVAAGGTFLLIALHPFPPRVEKGRLELTALDVGQAEALHLGLPDGSSMLVDAGGFPSYGSQQQSTFDLGEAVISPYLWSRSIRRLRVLALTHADADHIAGAAAVLRNFGVDELWLPAGADGEAELEPLRALAHERGADIVAKRAGDVVVVAGARIEALSGGAAVPSDKRNERSLVLLASFGETDFLLTGDIERVAERAILARLPLSRAGVLKVAHHGSRTSTHPSLLERFRPAFAIVSAGRKNVFGHPHPETVATLDAARVGFLSTAEIGCISVSSDGRRLRTGVCD